jgi:protocatechuate 3,4-dioxygenase beta subunit
MTAASAVESWLRAESGARPATPTDQLGPFYRKGTPKSGGHSGTLRAAGDPGLPLAVVGAVYDTRGAVLPEAKIEVWQTNHQARAYNAMDGKLVYAAEGDLLEPFDVSVSADGRTLAVAGAEGRVELRESASGKILKKSSSCGNPIFLVTMSPTAPTVLALILG